MYSNSYNFSCLLVITVVIESKEKNCVAVSHNQLEASKKF